MTPDYRPQNGHPRPSGLSSKDELFHRMIWDLTHVGRETRDILMKLLAQYGELRDDHTHLSSQVGGNTARLFRMEAAVEQISKQLPAPKHGGHSLWRETLERMSAPERAVLASLILTALLTLFGVIEPRDFRWKLRDLLGLPQHVSAPVSGAALSAPSSLSYSFRQ